MLIREALREDAGLQNRLAWFNSKASCQSLTTECHNVSIRQLLEPGLRLSSMGLCILISTELLL